MDMPSTFTRDDSMASLLDCLSGLVAHADIACRHEDDNTTDPTSECTVDIAVTDPYECATADGIVDLKQAEGATPKAAPGIPPWRQHTWIAQSDATAQRSSASTDIAQTEQPDFPRPTSSKRRKLHDDDEVCTVDTNTTTNNTNTSAK